MVILTRIASVTSNAPPEGEGDGDTSPDVEITGDTTLRLRAERSEWWTGRGAVPRDQSRR